MAPIKLGAPPRAGKGAPPPPLASPAPSTRGSWASTPGGRPRSLTPKQNARQRGPEAIAGGSRPPGARESGPPTAGAGARGGMATPVPGPSYVHTTETSPGPSARSRGRRPRNPALEAALAEDATLGRKNYHKRYAGRVARLANRAGLGSLAAAVGGCSATLALDTDGRCIGRMACRKRECPICQGARSGAWAARLHEAMPLLVAEHGHDWAFILLTLTVLSVPLADLHAAIVDLHASVDRLTKRAAFAPVGWVRNTEVTINAAGMAHPHVHVLAAVPVSYFAGPLRTERTARGQRRTVPGYMTHSQWRDLWRECARLDYAPVVDVRRVDGDLRTTEGRRSLYEVTKYGTKPSDMLSLAPDQFALLVRQMKGVRSIGIGGVLSAYLGDAPDDEAEDPRALSAASAVAAWNERARRYMPADERTAAAVQGEHDARRARASDLGRVMAARALRRGGMLPADYEAAAEAATRRAARPRNESG